MRATPSPAGLHPWAVAWRAQARALAAGNGLIGRFVYLALTQGVVVAIGLGYWAMTARLIPARSVGLAAAAVSTAAFLSALGILGVGSLLLAEMRGIDDKDRRVVLSSGVVVVAFGAGLLALLTWSLSSVLGHNLSAIGRQPLDAALMVVGAMCTGVASLLDAAAIGMHRSRVQLIRNAASSALRVTLVLVAVAVGVRDTTGLLVAWTASLCISFAIWPRLLRLPRYHSLSWSHRWGIVRRFWTMSLRHHVLNLAITSVTFILPVLAAVLLIPEDYAYFSIAQLVSSSALLLPALLAMSLFAEASGDPAQLRRNVRKTLPIGFACCLAILAIFEPGAPLVLSIFGHAYSSNGATTLRLLLFGGLFYVVKDHFVAIRRAQRQLTAAAKVVAVATGFELMAAAAGAALYGLPGLCAFWVAATAIEAGFFAPIVWRVAYGTPDPVYPPQSNSGHGGGSGECPWPVPETFRSQDPLTNARIEMAPRRTPTPTALPWSETDPGDLDAGRERS